jgi:hypothetical protein
MNRRGLWAAGVLLLVGLVGVLAIGTGYAKDEIEAAKCSEATLDGMYLFAQNGVEIKGLTLCQDEIDPHAKSQERFLISRSLRSCVAPP